MDKTKLERENYLGLYVWLALIALSLAFYFLRPDLFAPRVIRGFFSANLALGLGVYLLIATLRALTLIPLTPILVAGILVFPPLPLLLVTLVSVWTSSALIYYLARYLRFDRFFSEHYPAQIFRLSALLRKRELPIITAWGFFPFVPTDLIVYVCSVLRISVWKTLLGVSVGEGLICAMYIYGGALGLEALLDFLE